MGFGGKAPTPPAAQPQTPVPQADDPKLVDTQRRAAAAAKDREGYSAHLLSNSGQDTTLGETPDSAKLLR
jgi:hypothetical protein